MAARRRAADGSRRGSTPPRWTPTPRPSPSTPRTTSSTGPHPSPPHGCSVQSNIWPNTCSKKRVFVSFLEYGRLGFEVMAFSHFIFFKRCFPLAQAYPSGKVGASHPTDHLRAKVLSGGSVPGEVEISYPHPHKHACQMPSLTEA